MGANPSDKKSGKAPKGRRLHEAEGGMAGAVAGASVGSIAGPPGAVIGGVLGGIVGAAAAKILDEKAGELAEHERKLDDEIGVTSGEVGAPNLEHPPEANVAYAEELERRSQPPPTKPSK
jgi:phage tail tape-measure protein